MKKIGVLFLFLLGSYVTKAKVITVNNNVNALGQYSSLQTAIDDANVDDTLLVHGGGGNYGNITVTKRLTFIGEGYKNSVGLKAKLTEVNSLRIDTIVDGDVVSGTVIKGFKIFNLNTSLANGLPINNGIVSNCETGAIQLSVGKGWTIINSLCRSVTGTADGLEIYNSVISSDISSFKGGLLSNCVIAGRINNCSFIQCQNSIFTSTSSVLSGSNNIAFINTSFRLDEATANILPASSNTATDCLFEQLPNFIDEIDYQLDTSRPNVLTNAGTDGTDIGISGGIYPLKQLDGRVNLPQVSAVVIKTGVIAPGDNLIIDVTGRIRK